MSPTAASCRRTSSTDPGSSRKKARAVAGLFSCPHCSLSIALPGALQLIRADGLKVIAGCGFVADYLNKHPEFADLTG